MKTYIVNACFGSNNSMNLSVTCYSNAPFSITFGLTFLPCSILTYPYIHFILNFNGSPSITFQLVFLVFSILTYPYTHFVLNFSCLASVPHILKLAWPTPFFNHNAHSSMGMLLVILLSIKSRLPPAWKCFSLVHMSYITCCDVSNISIVGEFYHIQDFSRLHETQLSWNEV